MTGKSNKFNLLEKSNSLLNSIYLVVTYIILFSAIRGVLEGSVIATILAIPTIILVLFSMKKCMPVLNKINCTKVWVILYLLTIPMMLCAVYSLEVNLSWDWGSIIKYSHASFYEGNTRYLDYLARYPNNHFWYFIVSTVLKFASLFTSHVTLDTLKNITTGMSILFTLLTMLVIYMSARLLYDEKKAFLVGLAALLYAPFYLYAQFSYTDSPAMLICATLLYTYIKLKRTESTKRRIYLSVIIGLLSALAINIKILVLITTIAMLLDLVLKVISKNYKHLYSIAAIVISTVIFSSSLAYISNLSVPITKELSEKYKYPPTHWVMMGLGKSGGYNDPDDMFTRKFDTYEEKQDATISVIKKRLKDMGYVDTFKHVVSKKMLRTWGTSTLAGDDYCSRKPIRPKSLLARLWSLTGDKNWIGNIYTELFHLFIILGFAFVALFKSKRKNPLSRFFKFTIIGVTLFMMIWECNSRYLVSYIPVLLLLGAEGWSRIASKPIYRYKLKFLK